MFSLLPSEIISHIFSFDSTYKCIYNDVMLNLLIIFIQEKQIKKIFTRIKSLPRSFLYLDDIRYSKHIGDSYCNYLKPTNFIDYNGNTGFTHCRDGCNKAHYHFYCTKTKKDYKIYCEKITFHKALNMFKKI